MPIMRHPVNRHFNLSNSFDKIEDLPLHLASAEPASRSEL